MQPPKSKSIKMKWLLPFCLLLTAVLLFARMRTDSLSASITTMRGLPHVMVWAWERPENLEQLDPQQVGVAFLAKTIYLDGSRYHARPRMQPLKVANGTQMMAVVRIETMPHPHAVAAISETVVENAGIESGAADLTAPYSQAQFNSTVNDIVDAAQIPGVHAIQIDYDARRSERPFYARLIGAVRAKLPHDTALSITALAGWCLADHWIDGLPIDDAVPMLFQMGRESRDVKNYLRDGGDFRTATCQTSIGISTDEPIARVPTGRRIYLFHNRSAWTNESLTSAISQAEAYHAGR